jgi:hypothetical protein
METAARSRLILRACSCSWSAEIGAQRLPVQVPTAGPFAAVKRRGSAGWSRSGAAAHRQSRNIRASARWRLWVMGQFEYIDWDSRIARDQRILAEWPENLTVFT